MNNFGKLIIRDKNTVYVGSQKDEEIHQFILKEFKNLKFSSIIANLNEELVRGLENPKRMKRKIRKA
ncbi:DUF2992 family protein [Clostridium sp. JNZ J1-5]